MDRAPRYAVDDLARGESERGEVEPRRVSQVDTAALMERLGASVVTGRLARRFRLGGLPASFVTLSM
jgi:hypothetical protein